MTKKIVEQEWQKLNEFSHTRIRSEIYFGSRDPHTQTVLNYDQGKPIAVETTWIPSVYTCFREVLDNALDEVVTRGFGKRIDITYDETKSVFTISDDGRGIPINFDEKEKDYVPAILLGSLRSGSNFGDRGQSRGMNGVGTSGVNYCSEWFEIDIHRDKQRYQQRFTEGNLKEHDKEEPTILPTSKKETGTKVSFKLSKHVFKNMLLPESFVKARLFEIALCYPKISIYFNKEKISPKGTIEKILFGNSKPIFFEVDEEKFNSRFWLIPNFMENGDDISHSLVNGIPAVSGGTHLDAFKLGFYKGLIEALTPQSKKRRLIPSKSDIIDGLLVFNITEMDAPQFDSQSKSRMISESAAKAVRKAMDDPDFFKKVIKNNPEWIDVIYERCAERTEKKDASDLKKLVKKRVKVASLQDACGSDRSKCTLFICEGNSAQGGITEVRDSTIHGTLPLRGKILNVENASMKDVIANEMVMNIMNAVGLIPGQKANRKELRYGRLLITADADHDGKNICALVINCLYKLFPSLFDDNEAPFVYVFQTPLMFATKGSKIDYYYEGDPEKEFEKGWSVTRAKGLAALTKDVWKDVLKNPRIIPITDDGDMQETLSLIFDSDRADDRKEWLSK